MSKAAPDFWSSESWGQLRGKPSAQVVGFYLSSCRWRTPTGLFLLPVQEIAQQTGLEAKAVCGALQDLAAAGVALYSDFEQLVWDCDAARRAFGESLKPSDGRVSVVRANAERFRRSKLYRAFWERYRGPLAAALEGLDPLPEQEGAPLQGPPQGPPSPPIATDSAAQLLAPPHVAEGGPPPAPVLPIVFVQAPQVVEKKKKKKAPSEKISNDRAWEVLFEDQPLLAIPEMRRWMEHWFEHRRKHSSWALSEPWWRLQVEFLGAQGSLEAAVASLEKSARNGYQGLFPAGKSFGGPRPKAGGMRRHDFGVGSETSAALGDLFGDSGSMKEKP